MLYLFQLPSFDTTCSIISTTTSRSRKMNSAYNSNYNASKVAVPGIGFVTKLSSGNIRIDYYDGSAFIVKFYLTIVNLIYYYVLSLLSAYYRAFNFSLKVL